MSGAPPTHLAVAPPYRSTLYKILAPELKGDLSFLASDALQGRFTPSPGLDVAAEFIASKFRAIGLEPGGGSDYFQIARMVERRLPAPQSAITFTSGSESKPIELAAGSYFISQAAKAANIANAPVASFKTPDTEALDKLDVNGKAIVVDEPDLRHAARKMREFNRAVSQSQAAVEIVIRHSSRRPPASRLIGAGEAAKTTVPVVVVNADLALTGLQTVSLDIPAPHDTEVDVKNVIGILRGSDPQLKSTCVLLTAHYDHIGTIETGQALATPSQTATSDRIYNGANDDGSGTVSVIEIARALATLRTHPKRSLVFMTFFGEERGELGSQFYGQHPAFPIDKTVADINLEQVGRTDSTTGRQINTASLTGYDYSTVTQFLEEAGRQTGIKVYKDPEASDAYFTRSDNDALAEQGVPAHSLTVAFDYPDYHGLGDEWNKIDYDNMARVDRMIALGLLEIANSEKRPQWNTANPKTQPFREAQEKSRLGR